MYIGQEMLAAGTEDPLLDLDEDCGGQRKRDERECGFAQDAEGNSLKGGEVAHWMNRHRGGRDCSRSVELAQH